MKKGKHSSNRIIFFSNSKRGKHAKNEIVVYNPIYAKISACIGSFAVATSFLACVTFGKYKGTYASADTARAARYVLNLRSLQTSITEFVPNTTRSINFEVKNFEGELDNPTLLNEVKLRYSIHIDTPPDANLPLEYKLYRINSDSSQSELPLKNKISDYVEVSTTSEIHTYRLDVIWPDGLNQDIYQNRTDNIKVSVEVEQLD